MAEERKQQEKFRDKLSTVSTEGKRVWVYPKKPSGRFYRWRTYVSFLLLAIFFGMPFIKINGRPLFLFDILSRKFILFGEAFGPFDFHLFLLGMIAFIIFIILFTAIYGRLFCGWICPQTVFLEMVFRKIEYLIEGNVSAQKNLNESGWTFEKLLKKGSKWFIFLILSALVAHFLIAWVVGVDEVLAIVSKPPSEHPELFAAVIVFTGIFYFIFSWFREQACTIVCPYGRLQGVLLDENSLAVAYDDKRGEPRARYKRNEERKAGDCIDCHACADVCPTGINIRDGQQLECVNCTACIDACDASMDKVNLPRGLVRYASLANIEEGTKFRFTPRIISYTILLTVLISVIVVLLINRTDVEVNIMRTPGMLYQDQPDNKISNLYNFHVINKTFHDISVEFKLLNKDGKLVVLGDSLVISEQEVYEGRFMVVLDKDNISTVKFPLRIGVYQAGEEIDVIRSTFLSHIKPEKRERRTDRE